MASASDGSGPSRIATIDIGTNTVQLLVVEPRGTSLRRLHSAERFVRLGEGVDASGRIGSAAQTRLLTALAEYKEAAVDRGATEIIVTGTSALRDATNRTSVCDRVMDELGLHVDILSGAEEATWSFAAACSAFPDLSGECLVVDVGGGSTELISGVDPRAHHPRYTEAITGRASLNLGCVRLTERYFDGQPPSRMTMSQARTAIDAALNDTSLPIGDAPTLIGTAGTATALALVHLGPEASRDALDGTAFTLTRTDVQAWRERLAGLTVDEIRSLNPSAMEGRADVFTVGVLLLERIVGHFNRDHLRVSPYELRHGIALRTLASTSSTGTSS